MSENLAETSNEENVETSIDGQESFSSTIDRIRRAPSPEAWKAELDSVLERRRDHDIERLGSVSRHIRVIISGAESSQLAKDTFRTALNDLLEEWQPLISEPPERLYYILSLIEGFMPKTGFIKLAGYLKNDLRFYGSYDTPMGWNINFQSLALSALQAFYPAAPPSASSDAAYQTYVDILRLNLEHADYFGSCAARLIDLKELSYNSPAVLEGITHHQKGLDEIIRQIFYPYKPSTTGTNLGYLYVHCKENNLGEYFEECIKPYGSLVEYSEMEVPHRRSGRVDFHRDPSVYFVRNNTTLEIALTMNDTYGIHEPINSNMAKLKSLFENYRSAGGLLKKNYMEDIGEELSSIMEIVVTSEKLDFHDVDNELRRLGGELSNNDKDFMLVLDKKNIPLNIVSKSKLYFAMRKEKVTKRDFTFLVDKYDNAFNQKSPPKDGGH